MLTANCHSKSSGWTDVEDLTSLSDLREEGGNLLWAEADVSTLTEGDVRLVAEEFDLHPLAVEDAINLRQRPKLETYGNHMFVVMHELDEIEGQLEALQIACFVGDSFVLTLHAGATQTLTEAKKRWEEARIDRQHPSFLLHTLIDVVVDRYQEIADRLEDEIEDLEEIVLETPNAPVQRQLYEIKQGVARLRRYVVPGARVLEWAVDPDSSKPFSEETGELFRDVYDHLMRINDQVRNVDDLGQAVLELTRTAQADALNEVSRKLSAWAAIFAIETIIAGIYGMNFRLYPSGENPYGFWIAIGIMLLAGTGAYLYFKRRDWI